MINMVIHLNSLWWWFDMAMAEVVGVSIVALSSSSFYL